MIIFLIMCFSGILAISFDNDLENIFSSGNIDVMVETYTLNDNDIETIYKDKSIDIIPGKIISYIAKIYNIGDEAYVRAKIDITTDNDYLKNYLNISKISDKWIKKGEYYYYMESLKHDDVINFVEQLSLDREAGSYLNSENIGITVTAEAIQGKNFIPDFSSDSPFLNSVIKEKVTSGNQPQEEGYSKVTFSNKSESDILVLDGFLKNHAKIFPGDRLTQKIKIVNTTKGNAKYYISLNNSEQNDLLKQIKLKVIGSNNRIIYESDGSNLNKILLGSYSSGSYEEITLCVEFPKDLDNAFTNSKLGFVWNFSADYQYAKDIEGKNPNTGDFKTYIFLIIFLISSIIEFIIIFLIKRKWRNFYE